MRPYPYLHPDETFFPLQRFGLQRIELYPPKLFAENPLQFPVGGLTAQRVRIQNRIKSTKPAMYNSIIIKENLAYGFWGCISNRFPVVKLFIYHKLKAV